MAGGAFQTTALTFIGQNLGAGKKERVYRSFFYAALMGCASTATLALSIYAFRNPLLSIFVAGDPASIAQGAVRLKYIMLFYILNAVPMASAIQAFGHPTLQTSINIASILGLRTLWMQVFYPMNPTLDMLYVCFPITYVTNAICYLPIVIVLFRRLAKGQIQNKL